MAVHAIIGMTQSGMMGDGLMSGMMGGGMLIGWLVPLMVLVGLSVLVVWGIRELTRDRETGNPEEEDALATARRRYARGEIDREEFRTLRSDLETA